VNGGQLIGFVWDLCVWFFVLSVLVLPVVMTYWRHNEKKRAEQTEKTLQSLGFDTSGEHIYDA
jgi:hypothetical protein